MLKKGSDIRWAEESRYPFERIKTTIMEALVLIHADYTKDFIISPFSSEHTIATILLQKNEQGYRKTIAFFSNALQHVEIKYNIIDKCAYTLVKTLKGFREYILMENSIVYLLDLVVRDILLHHDTEGIRGKWIAKI